MLSLAQVQVQGNVTNVRVPTKLYLHVKLNGGIPTHLVVRYLLIQLFRLRSDIRLYAAPAYLLLFISDLLYAYSLVQLLVTSFII